MKSEPSTILVAPGRGVSPYEFTEPQTEIITEEEEGFDDLYILPVEESIEENETAEEEEEEAATIPPPKKKKKKKWALAFLLLCGVVIGVAIGMSNIANKRKNDTSSTSSSVLEAATLEDCLLAAKILEDQQLAPSVTNDEITDSTTQQTAAASKSGKSVKTDASDEPFVRRRDLRGSGKVGDNVDWLMSNQRRLECEELMNKSSKSSKTSTKKSNKSSKSSKQTAGSSGDRNQSNKSTLSPSKTVTPNPTEAPVVESNTQPPPSDSPPTNKPTIQQPDAPVTDSPTQKVTYKPVTNSPTQKVTLKPVTNSPSKAPTTKPVVTDSPTQKITPKPVTNSPTQKVTLKPVTNSPSKAPTTKQVTDSPTTSSAIPSDYYKYTTGTTQCSGTRVEDSINIDGPAPFTNKSNVALQFFAYGDTPYDSHANTCIGEDGSKETECSRFDCTGELGVGNTCTFEGAEYNCLRDVTIPWMNRMIDAGDAAFMAHTGDIIRGSGLGENKRCTNYTFSSRKELFSTGTNSLVVPGDNEWNECYGYRVSANTDPIREMWRENFARESSPMHQFGRDFPGGSKPTIYRQSSNPENYFFNHSGVAFFGINRPERSSYISDRAPVDINEQWVEERLTLDTTACTFKSIVILAHSWAKESLYGKIDEYFDSCGETLPILSVSGNTIPTSYCMSKDVTNSRVNVTVEAYQSAPLLISVVRDPEGGGDHFHVEDVDATDSNIQCPTFLSD